MYTPEQLITLMHIEELVEWIIDSWDVSALEEYVRESLKEYYLDVDNHDDYIENYENMVQIKGGLDD
jgi:hypothetical protein